MLELQSLTSMSRPAQSLPLSRVATLCLEGDIGKAELHDVGDMLFRYANEGVIRVIVDLSEVSHFDYRAVKPLLARASVFRAAGGDIKLAGLSPYLHAIFRSAGAHDEFDFFAQVGDARAAFHAEM